MSNIELNDIIDVRDLIEQFESADAADADDIETALILGKLLDELAGNGGDETGIGVLVLPRLLGIGRKDGQACLVENLDLDDLGVPHQMPGLGFEVQLLRQRPQRVGGRRRALAEQRFEVVPQSIAKHVGHGLVAILGHVHQLGSLLLPREVPDESAGQGDQQE